MRQLKALATDPLRMKPAAVPIASPARMYEYTRPRARAGPPTHSTTSPRTRWAIQATARQQASATRVLTLCSPSPAIGGLYEARGSPRPDWLENASVLRGPAIRPRTAVGCVGERP